MINLLFSHQETNFLCFRKSKSDWFTAAAKGDYIYIVEHYSKYTGNFDERDSEVDKKDNKKNIYCGFAAIHYAIV